MANSVSNDLFWDILKWIFGVGGTLLVVGVSISFWFLRDYFLRFHEAITILFQRFKDLESERSETWRHQGDFCRECYALLKQAIEIVKRRNG